MCNAFTDFTKDRPEVQELKEEIEQLKKERKWLIANWAEDKHYINNLWAVDQHSMDEHKEKIVKKMQQALKILDENCKLKDKIKNKEKRNETV